MKIVIHGKEFTGNDWLEIHRQLHADKDVDVYQTLCFLSLTQTFPEFTNNVPTDLMVYAWKQTNKKFNENVVFLPLKSKEKEDA